MTPAESKRQRREIFRLRGRCTNCGRPKAQDYTRCAKCVEAGRLAVMRSRAAKRKSKETV